jgi:hypothetical protein
MKNNDETILKLQEHIQIKKATVEKIEKFKPITNCNLFLNGTAWNLNATTIDGLHHLFASLTVLLNVGTDYTINGFKLSEWLIDIEAKLENMCIAIERTRLNVLENRLKGLLSHDKRAEIELDEIIKLI